MLSMYRMKIMRSQSKETADTGRAWHGLFFRLLSQTNPELATRIHAGSLKPFCLWPLTTDTVRIAALGAEMQDAMAKMAVQRYGGITFAGQSVEVDIEKGEAVKPQELWENYKGLSPLGNLRIQFQSPTSFRRDGVQELFPEPGLVIRSLYKKAAACCGTWFSQEAVPPDEFTAYIRVARYELKTLEAGFGQYKIIGCVGSAIYDCRRVTVPVERRTVALLTAIAPFTGVGYKTTMGMGRVECELEGGMDTKSAGANRTLAREAPVCKKHGRGSMR